MPSPVPNFEVSSDLVVTEASGFFVSIENEVDTELLALRALLKCNAAKNIMLVPHTKDLTRRLVSICQTNATIPR